MSTPPASSTPAFDWVLADCPACGNTMKLRYDRVGICALLCPVCKAPIAIEFARTPPAAAPPAPPPPKAPQPRKSQDPTFAAELPARSQPAVPKAANEVPSHLPSGRSGNAATPQASFAPTPLPTRTTAPPEARTNEPTEALQDRGNSHVPNTRKQRVELIEANPNSGSEGRVLPPVNSRSEAGFLEKLKVMEDDLPHKQKRRRRLGPGELRLADWDTPDLADIPEAEIRADDFVKPGEVELLPDFLVQEKSAEEEILPEEVEGMVAKRKKRKGRRRLGKGLQSLYRRMSVTARWAALILLLTIFGAGVWYLVQTFNTRAVASASEPTQERMEGAAEVAMQKLLDISLEDMEGSLKVVQSFLAAPTTEAKLAFVRLPERVKPLMEKWYALRPTTGLSSGNIEQVTLMDADGNPYQAPGIRKSRVGNSYFIFLVVRFGPDNAQRYFSVEHIPPVAPQTRSTYLLDWETSVGYQPMELTDFRAKQPREPQPFRVNFAPAQYWNYAFEDQDRWLSFRLSYPGEADFEIYGYVERTSEIATELQQQMYRDANCILQLRYPPEAISRDQVIIDKIVHPSWFYERDEVSAKPMR
jgi:hypothetical protein